MLNGRSIVIGFVYFAFLASMGAVFASLGWFIVQETRGNQDWPTADGRITASVIDYHQDSDGADRYSAKINYVYTVDGRQYGSQRVRSRGYTFNHPRQAQQILDRYQVGQTVTVYYKPDDPQTAFLETGGTWAGYLVLGIGVIISVAAFVIAPLAARQAGAAPKPAAS